MSLVVPSIATIPTVDAASKVTVSSQAQINKALKKYKNPVITLKKNMNYVINGGNYNSVKIYNKASKATIKIKKNAEDVYIYNKKENSNLNISVNGSVETIALAKKSTVKLSVSKNGYVDNVTVDGKNSTIKISANGEIGEIVTNTECEITANGDNAEYIDIIDNTVEDSIADIEEDSNDTSSVIFNNTSGGGSSAGGGSSSSGNNNTSVSESANTENKVDTTDTPVDISKSEDVTTNTEITKPDSTESNDNNSTSITENTSISESIENTNNINTKTDESSESIIDTTTEEVTNTTEVAKDPVESNDNTSTSSSSVSESANTDNKIDTTETVDTNNDVVENTEQPVEEEIKHEIETYSDNSSFDKALNISAGNSTDVYAKSTDGQTINWEWYTSYNGDTGLQVAKYFVNGDYVTIKALNPGKAILKGSIDGAEKWIYVNVSEKKVVAKVRFEGGEILDANTVAYSGRGEFMFRLYGIDYDREAVSFKQYTYVEIAPDGNFDNAYRFNISYMTHNTCPDLNNGLFEVMYVNESDTDFWSLIP